MQIQFHLIFDHHYDLQNSMINKFKKKKGK